MRGAAIFLFWFLAPLREFFLMLSAEDKLLLPWANLRQTAVRARISHSRSLSYDMHGLNDDWVGKTCTFLRLHCEGLRHKDIYEKKIFPGMSMWIFTSCISKIDCISAEEVVKKLIHYYIREVFLNSPCLLARISLKAVVCLKVIRTDRRKDS